MPHIVRRIRIGESELYRCARLAALKEAPEAFCSTYADALQRTPESWVEQADGSAIGNERATMLALIEGQVVGLAALYRRSVEPTVGDMLQVWVAAECRGGQVAPDLLRALFAWASEQQIVSVIAEIIDGNERALQFYRRFGFEPATQPGSGAGIVTLERAVERA